VAVRIVRLRWLIAPVWIAGAIAGAVFLPSIFATGSGALGNLLPTSSPAIEAEREALHRFGVPFVSRALAVARPDEQLRGQQVSGIANFVAAVNEGSISPHLRAVPLIDYKGLLEERKRRPTLLTFLYLNPILSTAEQEVVAREFVNGLGEAGGIGEVELTGPVPAGWSQEEIGETRLHWLELATVAIVILMLALYFRAPAIPLLGLATVGVAYSVSVHLLGWLGEVTEVTMPSEVGPVLIALLFGALTDYAVFFIAGWRRRLAEGEEPLRAVELVTEELLPVVLTAALMIAGSIAMLLLSGVRFLTAFVPGLAVSVLVGAAVAVTFIPAALALVGPRLLWPTGPGEARDRREEARRPRARVVAVAARHPVAVLVPCVAVLGAFAFAAKETALGEPVIRGLPESSSARQGYELASSAFGPGIVGPTMVVVKGNGIAAKRKRLAALERLLAAQPGVADVLGPADSPLRNRYGVVLSPAGYAARFMVLLDADPTSAEAIGVLSDLEQRLPRMLRAVGLGDAEPLIGGDTAIAAELTERTESALVRVLPAVIFVLFLLLWWLLRSKAAAALLVAANLLTVAAALGASVVLFQFILDYGELAFFVPISATILLLALGSDYNVFFVSRIWEEARHVDLQTAIRVAGSRAGRAVTLAGMILVLSFAAVALVPILAFRQLAFAMCVGLLLDTLVSRTLLIPAIVSLLGPRSAGSR
jgi:RND superfamily putative drug exporter